MLGRLWPVMFAAFQSRRFVRAVVVLLVVAGVGAWAVAQSRGVRRFSTRGPVEGPIPRGNIPNWAVDGAFKGDLFTFARLRYRSTYERQSLAWYTDYPDADLNLSFRLQQLTTLKVNPEPKLVEINDPNLADYPFLFMSGVGNIVVDDEEAAVLRRYLTNGGFVLVDDFWGEEQWDNFYAALKQILPEREPVDLPRGHPIFHCVYDIPDDRPLQTPNVGFAVRNRDTGITWERPDAQEVHYRGVFDDKGRMMMMICHNTDTGDGWEEEGTDPWFFQAFAEPKCYPLAFNIVFYAMTH